MESHFPTRSSPRMVAKPAPACSSLRGCTFCPSPARAISQLRFLKKKSPAWNPQRHSHQQKCRPQNQRSTRLAQLAAHSSPTFGGGGPKARTIRRSPFLCIDVIPQCLCPDTGAELLAARSSENCNVSLRSRAVHSSFYDRSPARHLRSPLRP